MPKHMTILRPFGTGLDGRVGLGKNTISDPTLYNDHDKAFISLLFITKLRKWIFVHVYFNFFVK